MIKRNSKLLALSALLGSIALAQPAKAAADWQYMLTAAGGKITYFLDVNSVRRNASGIVTYWVKTIYSPPTKFDNKLIDDDRYYKQVDCVNRRSRGLQLTSYFTNGESLTSTSNGEWRYVTPETVGETELEHVCAFAR